MRKRKYTRNEFIVDGIKKDVTKEDWDVLIILDACRFDKFDKYYKNYFKKGELKKAISPATHTSEFLYRCFKEKMDDVIYLSGNMYVNSMGIPLNHWSGKYEWIPTYYFKRIIDVWDTGYSQEKGTILPKAINEHAIPTMDLNKKNRFIIHYMQPHAPYLTWSKTKRGEKQNKHEKDRYKKIKNKFRLILFNHVKEELIWKTAHILGFLHEGGNGDLFISEGREGYIRQYENNVQIVLEYVRQLIKKYPKKKFLIIADHGERLGENGNYGHTKTHIRDPAILEVPWFEIKRTVYKHN